MSDTPADQSTLDPLPFWQARSFWFLLVSTFGAIWMALDQIATQAGWDMPNWAFMGREDLIVNAIMAVATPVSAFLAWWERRAPRKRLTIK